VVVVQYQERLRVYTVNYIAYTETVHGQHLNPHFPVQKRNGTVVAEYQRRESGIDSGLGYK